MEGKQEEKISFLTPARVKAYKSWLLFIMVSLVLGMAFSEYLAIRAGHSFTPSLFMGCVFIYQAYRIFKGVKPAAFDRRFLYVTESGYEILVPVDNIKKVEIKNLGGIYKVSFFDQIQSGTYLYFKPSLIYPLDFKKQDEKVNILRSYAWNARQNREPLPKNALAS